MGHAEVAPTKCSCGVGVCVCVWCAGAVHVASVVCGSGSEGWVRGLWCLCRICGFGGVLCGVARVGEVVGQRTGGKGAEGGERAEGVVRVQGVELGSCTP